MNTLKNNKGITLVEIIVGVAIFAIASVALVQGFVSSANIINRATLYKNASAAASSAVELQDTEDVSSPDSSVSVELVTSSGTLKIKGTRGDNGESVTATVEGSLYSGVDKGTGKSQINYKEFVPGIG